MRIVHDMNLTLFFAVGFHLTLKNVSIFNTSKGLHHDLFAVQNGKLDMVDVRVFGSNRDVLSVQSGSVVKVLRSTFVDCRGGFIVLQSHAVFTECKWKNVESLSALFESDVNIASSSMVGVGNGGLSFLGAVNATCRDNQLVGLFDFNADSSGIHAAFGAQLTVANSSIAGFSEAVRVSSLHSSAEIRNCKFDCGIALRSFMNSTVSIADSELGVKFVLRHLYNVHGKIEFRRNTLKGGSFHEDFQLGDPAIFLLDRRSGNIEHDFESLQVDSLLRRTHFFSNTVS